MILLLHNRDSILNKGLSSFTLERYFRINKFFGDFFLIRRGFRNLKNVQNETT